MTHSSKFRHIVSVSGGKDSTALAVYLRDRVLDLECVFCDTEHELPETYEYLDQLEAYLGRRIVRLSLPKDDHGRTAFEHYLALRRGFLPSPRNRWCTEHLKLRPLEQYVGDGPVYNYIGLRADEDRQGYISHKPNIVPLYPFREAGIGKADVLRILDEAGLGLPKYREWRTRSGCSFCFFQQKIEWVGLLENHPDLFEEAQKYERAQPGELPPYTWTQGETLDELARPERIAQIKDRHRAYVEQQRARRANRPLMEVVAGPLDDDYEDEIYDEACLICTL
jgi:hypothetical protein